MSDIDIQEAGRRSWGRLSAVSVSGIGRISPRLQVVLAAHPSRYADIDLLDVSLRLEHRNELIGEGRATPGRLHDGANVVFEIPTSPRVLTFVTNSLTQTTSAVQLDATLKGRGQFVRGAAHSAYPRQVDDPEIGKPREFPVSGMPTALLVPRSDWYERVIKPTHGFEFAYLEVAIPAVASPGSDRWRQALHRLHDAERHFASGDDASVFLQLRGALDALPGAPKDILASVTNARKRKAMDELLSKAGAYLHSGRHVSQAGADAGEFPVDHLDAAFALDLVRVLLSHLSLILGAEVTRHKG